ncbi:MAG: DNA methyltransferase [Terriglobales bacterium]|jgi:DNA modification methylase
MSFNQLQVTYEEIQNLVPYARNARTHSKRQIRQIADCIHTFGFTNPVLVNRSRMIIAGHGRVDAAKLLGMKSVPTICLENLSDDQIRAYILADNRLAEKAGWDISILAIELQHLTSLDLQFDVSITGFEVAEIDLILEEAEKEKEEEDPVEISSGPAVTKPGDIWLLGDHRLICGDALDESTYCGLMNGQKADVVFADPPYNVRIDGNVCGQGAIRHREFRMASGEMSEREFSDFLCQALSHLERHSSDGSVHFICMDWRHAAEILLAGKKAYDTLLNLCVWTKDNGGMGSLYRSQHELIFVFRKGNELHRNNVQLGRFGRNRTNVWRYPGVNTLSKSGVEGNLLALHPTVKPVAMIADAILDCSARGDVVLDNFSGVGSTILAAEKVGRVCYGIEIDPLYIDTAVQRWEKHTGQRAIHAATRQYFDPAEVTCG